MSQCGAITLLVALAVPMIAGAQTPGPARQSAVPLRTPVPGAPPGVTAFVDVAVVPMDTERVLVGQTMLVERGWITALGPSPKVKVPAGAVRIDGQGRYLIPGLADMHAHMTDLRKAGSDLRQDYLFRFLAGGVTTIRIMDHLVGGPLAPGGDSMLQWRAQAAAGTLLSPRIYTSGSWGPNHYTNSSGARTDQPGAPRPRLDSVALYLAAYKAAGYDFLKPYNERRPVFDSVLVAARRLGLPLAGHIPQTDTSITLEQVLASGAYASIEHLRGGYEWERQPFDLSTIPALSAATQRAGVWNTPTLAVFAHLSPAMLDVRRKLVKGLQDAGAGLLLGSDADEFGEGWLIAGFAVHQELTALVGAGLTPYQALLTGTRNVAQYFGTLDSTGTVAVGKRADLVLLSENPLRDVRHAREPVGVMLGGRWLARDEIDRRLISRVGAGDAVRDWLLRGVRASMTAEQRTTLRQLTTSHATQLKTFTDSLGSDSAKQQGAGRARTSQLFAGQFGALRAILTPEQCELFDVSARVWIRDQARQGVRVTISGVTPS